MRFIITYLKPKNIKTRNFIYNVLCPYVIRTYTGTREHYQHVKRRLEVRSSLADMLSTNGQYQFDSKKTTKKSYFVKKTSKKIDMCVNSKKICETSWYYNFNDKAQKKKYYN